MFKQYKIEEYDRVRKNLYTDERRIFGTKNDLAAWFIQQLKKQNYCCYYCETSIFLIKKLIANKLLKTRNTRGEGKRGPVLEIDKNDDTYIPGNCVLSCYYCNNDKSYISAKEDYKKYFGENRKKYFEELIKQIIDV